MITLSRKKVNTLSRLLTLSWLVIIFATKSPTWMTIAGVSFLLIMYTARYLYYKQLADKTERRKYLIGELAGLGLFVIAMIIISAYVKR